MTLAPLARASEVVQGEVEIDTDLYTPVFYQAQEGGASLVILMKRGEVEADSGII